MLKVRQKKDTALCCDEQHNSISELCTAAVFEGFSLCPWAAAVVFQVCGGRCMHHPIRSHEFSANAWQC